MHVPYDVKCLALGGCMYPSLRLVMCIAPRFHTHWPSCSSNAIGTIINDMRAHMYSHASVLAQRAMYFEQILVPALASTNINRSRAHRLLQRIGVNHFMHLVTAHKIQECIPPCSTKHRKPQISPFKIDRQRCQAVAMTSKVGRRRHRATIAEHL